MTDPVFADAAAPALPVHLCTVERFEVVLGALPADRQAWVRASGFVPAPGATLLLPGADGGISGALVGLGDGTARARQRFVAGAAIARLPKGTWELAGGAEGLDPDETGLGWLLSTYRFDRYAAKDPVAGVFKAPAGTDPARLEAIAAGEVLTRDLINTPAADMGPAELEDAARRLADSFGACVSVTTGSALLDANLPLIHTVGRAAAREPRLIELAWGAEGPALTLVGKGVCFDTGGLNLKPGASMALMKKDMGGAATVLGLARMIMALGLKLRLRVLIPTVENAVSGNAFRPGDILTARNGRTVEINNTDAEGRLVLADALALAAVEAPDLSVSMATLTGAARVAVGPDIAPFYTDSAADAAALAAAAERVRDPVWQLPFHAPYEELIESGIADLDNAPSSGMAGSITAALFLRRFTAGQRYMHFDIYGWQQKDAPARPKGGVGQGARALLEALPALLPL